MNRNSLINFLIQNGILSSTTGNKINKLIAKLFNLRPAYTPVPVKVKAQQHPAFKNR
ncbi:hypothetical protein [Mucilaginibacter sp.]|jgi:hypothetical protein|uniref:hypothetical protein n=1 Tax=Mucilaginibacter sp. TaxID=1882438 RepID=UPI0026362113|nr:hypothetical protein [Mucilaginibacter sp.]MDB4923590.1 hypothetical protein [Mucilaginibacter sp.]